VSSKPFFKKSLRRLVKAFSKEVVEKTGRHSFQIGDFVNFQGFAGILNKSRKMGGNPNFCSALPGFLYQKVRKESYFLDTIEEIEENLK
jgi:hypothetical protein